jgi:hypothetical protein
VLIYSKQRLGNPIYACHEAVASSGDIDHKALTFLSVAQGTPQHGHMEARAALLDYYVGPGFGHQCVFADDLARAAHQEAEKVECTTAN